MRKSYGSKFKSKVAIEAIKDDKPIVEISSSFEVRTDQIKMRDDIFGWNSQAIFR